MSLVTVTHNGFHGHKKARIRPRAIVDDSLDPNRQLAVVSWRVAKRLNQMVCPCNNTPYPHNCACGERWIRYHADSDHSARTYYDAQDHPDRYEWLIPLGDTRGRYPQGE